MATAKQIIVSTSFNTLKPLMQHTEYMYSPLRHVHVPYV